MYQLAAVVLLGRRKHGRTPARSFCTFTSRWNHCVVSPVLVVSYAAADLGAVCDPRRSLGCVFYELTAQRPTFNAFNIHGLVSKIKKNKLAPLPSTYSSEWRDIINMWVAQMHIQHAMCGQRTTYSSLAAAARGVVRGCMTAHCRNLLVVRQF